MVNANLSTLIVAAVGGFMGALIGNSFTGGGAPQPVKSVAPAKSCAPTPCPEPETPSCPDCPEPNCPACSCPGSSDASAVVSSSGLEGGTFRHNLKTPGRSWNVRNYYPLQKSFNRFERWYDEHRTGKGVWKWTQYFPAYERHLGKFIDRSWAGEEVHMAELGIFSGGSLEMWQAVFGPGLRLWGLDIALVTKQYEQDDKSGRTKIFNLDQTNPESWNAFKKEVPKLDILIDDGLHLFTGQKASLDNILSHIQPGGVFMTEDISDGRRPGAKASKDDGPEYEKKYLDYSFSATRPLHYERSTIQNTVDGVHYYPYLLVVEKRTEYLHPTGSGKELAAIKHGTLWKPIGRGVVKGDHAQ